MLGIWHGGDSLKRDLAQPIYGWVERGSVGNSTERGVNQYYQNKNFYSS